MCYYLYVASPLTLSEIRSMLATGISADALTGSEPERLLRLHPDGQTVARLVHGSCSCDLLRARDPDRRRDEAFHRKEYRKLGYGRDRVLDLLEIHRRGAAGRHRPPEYWNEGFNSFVREHARNAGPTLYYRHFSHDGLTADEGLERQPEELPAAAIAGAVADWLPDRQPVMVVP